jgi:ABC-2 type transport system permease protein
VSRPSVFGHNVFDKALRDQRWQIIGFGLALALMASTSVWLWPSVRDSLQNFKIPPAVQALLGSDLDIATAAGYLSGRYFAWTILLVLVYAIIAGTGAIAGEEGAGTMDLLLSQPVRRADAVLQKVAATVAGTVVVVALGYAGFLVSVPTVSINVGLGDVAVACANMLPISLFFFGLSVWAGAVAPNRGVASGFVIAVTTAAYFLYTLSNGVESLRELRYATPFYYYGAGLPLVEGIVWWHAGLLVGLGAVFVALAVRTFERRDVSPGGATDLSVRAIVRRMVAARTGI